MPSRKVDNQELPVRVERAIMVIRGKRVMLDSALAELYEVSTSALTQAVKRNLQRFPSDFMFQLTEAELQNWRSQIVISKPSSRMGLRRRPFAFTEQGVAMLSSVLRSQRAIQVNVTIMRAFVRLRELTVSHRDLARRLDALEARYDKNFRQVFEAIRELMRPIAAGARQRIGFESE